jgi:hypothetical protein
MPKSDGMWFLMFIIIMFALWLSGGIVREEVGSIPKALVGERGLLSISGNDSDNYENRDDVEEGEDSYSNIKLNLGNIRSVSYPEDQYIYITNRGWRATEPVYVGGWTMENGSLSSSKNKKKIVLPVSGIEYYNPYNLTGNKKSPLVLYPGDTLVVSVGENPSGRKLKLESSFKENVCMGYLENLSGLDFLPSLRVRCPSELDFIDRDKIRDECYSLVRRLLRCTEPKVVNDCVNSYCEVPSSCRRLVEDIFGYENCFNKRKNQENFLGDTWRVYLGYSSNIFRKSNGYLALYDNQGLLVDRIEY